MPKPESSVVPALDMNLSPYLLGGLRQRKGQNVKAMRWPNKDALFFHHSIWHVIDGVIKGKWREGEIEAGPGSFIYAHPSFDLKLSIPPLTKYQLIHFHLLPQKKVFPWKKMRKNLTEAQKQCLQFRVEEAEPTLSEILGVPIPLVWKGYDLKALEILVNSILSRWVWRKSPENRLAANAMLYQLLSHLLFTYSSEEGKPQEVNLIRQAREIAKSDLTSTVESIANQLGVSKSHLDKVFREERRLSLGTEIRRAKYAKALDLLSNTNMPIRAVSKRVGYSSPATFSSQFKRRFGNSPLEYRKLQKLSK